MGLLYPYFKFISIYPSEVSAGDLDITKNPDSPRSRTPTPVGGAARNDLISERTCRRRGHAKAWLTNAQVQARWRRGKGEEFMEKKGFKGRVDGVGGYGGKGKEGRGSVWEVKGEGGRGGEEGERSLLLRAQPRVAPYSRLCVWWFLIQIMCTVEDQCRIRS